MTRNASGIRDFQTKDLIALEFIKCFRSAGVSVESLIYYMSLYSQGQETREARLAILQEEREKLQERLDELASALKRLDVKIDRYQKGQIN